MAKLSNQEKFLNACVDSGPQEVKRLYDKKDKLGIDINFLTPVEGESAARVPANLDRNSRAVQQVMDDLGKVRWTPFAAACSRKKGDKEGIEVVKFLCSLRNEGLDVHDSRSSQAGASGFMIACERANFMLVSYFLTESGIKFDLEQRSANGHTPFTIAFCHLPEASNSQERMLSRAAMKDVMAIGELLASHGADVNATKQDGHTTLTEGIQARIQKQYPQIMDFLLNLKEIDVNKPGAGGLSPFATACAIDDLELARKLASGVGEEKKKVADINQPDANGNTPLMAACMADKKATVEFLLGLGAATDIQNIKGETAFSIACAKSEKIADLFIKKELSNNTLDKKGYTPFLHATKTDKVSVMKSLVQKGLVNLEEDSAAHQAIVTAAFGKAVSSLSYLLSAGVNINAQDGNGNTPFMKICSISKEASEGQKRTAKEAAQFLISKKADVELGNKQNETPLSMAIIGGHLEIVQLIVNKCGIEVLDREIVPGGPTPSELEPVVKLTSPTS